MPIANDTPWTDLETKGFVHIRGFVPEADLAQCHADFAVQPLDVNNLNNPVSAASQSGVAGLKDAIHEVMALVRANTNIRVDCGLGAVYFATHRGVAFPWHQDHESYFSTQNHYDYLNFFIPIVKPVKEKSNLIIVPFDVLERTLPVTFRRVVRSGATMVFDIGGRHVLCQSDSATAHLTRQGFESIACTPQLAAGDLLLMRGDILHRTQDADTERVALSVRVGYGGTMVSRARLADGGFAKAQSMVGNFKEYELMFRAFDASGKNEMPLSELLGHVREQRNRPVEIVERPRRYLLRQKMRSGVLLSSIAKGINELITQRVRFPYYLRQTGGKVSTDPAALRRM
jgi:hypothetical protein